MRLIRSAMVGATFNLLTLTRKSCPSYFCWGLYTNSMLYLIKRERETYIHDCIIHHFINNIVNANDKTLYINIFIKKKGQREEEKQDFVFFFHIIQNLNLPGSEYA